MCSWGKSISAFLSWMLPLNEPGNPPLFSYMLEDSMENSSKHEEIIFGNLCRKTILIGRFTFWKNFFIYRFDLNNCQLLVGHSYLEYVWLFVLVSVWTLTEWQVALTANVSLSQLSGVLVQGGSKSGIWAGEGHSSDPLQKSVPVSLLKGLWSHSWALYPQYLSPPRGPASQQGCVSAGISDQGFGEE